MRCCIPGLLCAPGQRCHAAGRFFRRPVLPPNISAKTERTQPLLGHTHKTARVGTSPHIPVLRFGHNSEHLANKGVFSSQTGDFAPQSAIFCALMRTIHPHLASETIYDRISACFLDILSIVSANRFLLSYTISRYSPTFSILFTYVGDRCYIPSPWSIIGKASEKGYAGILISSGQELMT